MNGTRASEPRRDGRLRFEKNAEPSQGLGVNDLLVPVLGPEGREVVGEGHHAFKNYAPSWDDAFSLLRPVFFDDGAPVFAQLGL